MLTANCLFTTLGEAFDDLQSAADRFDAVVSAFPMNRRPSIQTPLAQWDIP